MDNLLSKKGVIYLEVCKILLELQVNEKLPSICKLATALEVGRGTVQKVILELESDKIIGLQKFGRNGTIIVKLNKARLLERINKNHFFGVLPLPYTLRYEGLATALKKALTKEIQASINLSYVKDAQTRVKMLVEGRVDFAVFSTNHAQIIMQEHPSLIEFFTLHPNSYLSKHVLVKTKKSVKNVGIDANSYVHRKLIEQNFTNVNLLQIPYAVLKRSLLNGTIDATILNYDDLEEESFICAAILEDDSYLKATLLINQESKFLKSIINQQALIKQIQLIQTKVLEKKIDPEY